MSATAATHYGIRARRIIAMIALVSIAFFAALRQDRADASPQAAATANSFVDSIGVATHFSYTDTAYGRFAELKSRLAELGVHHIREDLGTNRPDQYQRLNELASAGIGSTLIMGSPNNSVATLESLLTTVRTKLTKVDALEGPNEYYLSGKPNWTTLNTSYQQSLYEKAKSNPATASLPVLGPTTIFWQTGELGNISNFLDYGTIHPYPGGYPEEDYEGRHIEFAARSSATKALVATETGYHNAMNSNDGHPPVSEAAAATYMPRVFLSSFERGVKRTFVYELVDEQPDPGMTDIEKHFGLLRNDLSPKPAFTAISNLTSILSDPGSEFTPGSIDYSISGNTEKLHQVLLQKRDGSYYLALWRASSVWNPPAKTPIEPGAPGLTVRFNTPFSSVQAFAPNVSAAPIADYNQARSVNLAVGPQVTILKLVPTAGGAPVETSPPPVTEEPPVPVTPPVTPPAEELPATAPIVTTPTAAPPASTMAPPVTAPVAAPGTTAPTSPATPPATKPSTTPPASTPAKAKPPRRVKAWVKKRGRRVYVHGRVASSGTAQVAVQQRSADGWTTIGRAYTDGSGSFKALVDLAQGESSGTVDLRVAAPGAQPSAPFAVTSTV